MITSGYFNAINGDRQYNAEQMTRYFEKIISDGVFANPSTNLQVMAHSGMQVKVKAGRGMIKSRWIDNDGDYLITLKPSNVALPRIDSIVMRLDLRESVRAIVIDTLQGTPSQSPVAPSLTRNNEVYELCLAQIRVEKLATSITQANITDTRLQRNVCGFIHGLIEQVDTSTLYNQYQTAQNVFINEQTTAFNSWFSSIKEMLLNEGNIYREYRAVYITTIQNENTLTIPKTINYIYKSYDNLQVIVNGLTLSLDEYTFNSTGTQITLKLPLTQIGTRVEFINKKSVGGKLTNDTILRLETLERQLNEVKNIVYFATGNNDNTTLSNMVKNFLNGIGEYASVTDTSQLGIMVVGNVGIGNAIGDHIFDFNSNTQSNRRVVVDFSKATIPPIAKTGNLAIFSCTNNVKIVRANIKVTKQDTLTLYALYGGEYEDCCVNINGNNKTGTIHGAYACKSVSNSEINVVNGSGAINGAYSCEKVLYNTIKINVGTSIKANGKQLLMGNFVDKAVSVDSSVVQVGTVML